MNSRQANIEAYSNVDFLRARLAARDLHASADEYAKQSDRQNSGLTCSHCDCESGHKISCPLINREYAETKSADVAELNRIFSLDAEKYELINSETEETHGTYDTLDEARGAAKYDRLAIYAIWRGNVRVEAAVD